MSAEQEESKLMDHCYDGIQEYDNPMPGWWSWTFIGTIVFSTVYYFIVTMAGGQFSANASYDRAVMADLMKQGGTLQGDTATIKKLMNDKNSMAAGQSVFMANCVACHGRSGEGLIGPNLTDEKYIHVKKLDDIIDVVNKGRNNGAMPSWANRLSNNEQVMVSAYVASLRGQNKSGPRPAEGVEIPKW